ncbi:MAG: hypothetical protein ACOVQZ_00830, partial [Candidatus Nanopelagicaceae bacterium]
FSGPFQVFTYPVFILNSHILPINKCLFFCSQLFEEIQYEFWLMVMKFLNAVENLYPPFELS